MQKHTCGAVACGRHATPRSESIGGVDLLSNFVTDGRRRGGREGLSEASVGRLRQRTRMTDVKANLDKTLSVRKRFILYYLV